MTKYLIQIRGLQIDEMTFGTLKSKQSQNTWLRSPNAKLALALTCNLCVYFFKFLALAFNCKFLKWQKCAIFLYK